MKGGRPMIELSAKKSFLSWLIQSVPLKKRESYWILNYLINHEAILKRVSFVEHALSTPRGLQITDQTVKGSGLSLMREGVLIENPEDIFYDIRKHRKETLFVEVLFDGQHFAKDYLNVLEENSYQPIEEEHQEAFFAELDFFLNQEQKKKRLAQLTKDIDLALEENNTQAFIELTTEYNNLKK